MSLKGHLIQAGLDAGYDYRKTGAMWWDGCVAVGMKRPEEVFDRAPMRPPARFHVHEDPLFVYCVYFYNYPDAT